MPEYHITENDFKIKYSNCFVKTINKDVIKLYNVNMGQLTGTFNGKLAEVKVPIINEINITTSKRIYIPVSSLELKKYSTGVFNLKSTCIIINSLRPGGGGKYRLLPHPENIKMIDPFQEERSYLGSTQPKSIFNYFILKAWGEEKYFPASVALEEVLNHKRLGCAFNNEYFFGLSLAGDSVFLYKNFYKIAKVNENGQILLPPSLHCLYEQLSEYGLDVNLQDKF